MTADDVFVAGWGWPTYALSAHYFEAGTRRSICGAWGGFGGWRVPDSPPSVDLCYRCQELLDERKVTT